MAAVAVHIVAVVVAAMSAVETAADSDTGSAAVMAVPVAPIFAAAVVEPVDIEAVEKPVDIEPVVVEAVAVESVAAVAVLDMFAAEEWHVADHIVLEVVVSVLAVDGPVVVVLSVDIAVDVVVDIAVVGSADIAIRFC